MMRVLAVACILAFAPTTLAHARKRPALAYVVAECTAWPWSGNEPAGAKLRHLRRRIKNGKLRSVFRILARNLRVAAEARRIGLRLGRKVWSVRGPKALGAALSAAGCIVTAYPDVLALPAGHRNWIQSRSTCIGTGTRAGRAVTIWPCSDASVSVTTVTAIAPRVMMGGNARAVAGVSPP